MIFPQDAHANAGKYIKTGILNETNEICFRAMNVGHWVRYIMLYILQAATNLHKRLMFSVCISALYMLLCLYYTNISHV
jgi:hypothetical protein